MGSDVKYTKGPWSVDRNNTHAGQIATIHHCINNDWIEIWSTNWPDNEETQEANATLIAAAPELLEALEIVNDYNYLDGCLPPDIAEKMHRAISKAKGQSND